jgi:aryl-alcohol dehydrogenase-like predicted oxidoreductase
MITSAAGPETARRSRIVLGTFALADNDVSAALLDRYYEAGGRALDLANVYLDGEASRAAGTWLRQRGLAGDMVLYAKGCHPPACHPDLVRQEVEYALRLTGLDYLDVFLLHRDNTEVPVQAWVDALGAEAEAGRIGAFGVSNWRLGRTRELRRGRGGRGDHGLVAFSNHFSLAELVAEPWPDCIAVTRTSCPSWGPWACACWPGPASPPATSPGASSQLVSPATRPPRPGSRAGRAARSRQPPWLATCCTRTTTCCRSSARSRFTISTRPRRRRDRPHPAEAAWLERGGAPGRPPAGR